MLSIVRSLRPTAVTQMVAARGYATGTVKWFNMTRGFGFITNEEDDKEYFVHQTSINMIGFRGLIEGERVQFDITENDKGPFATNISAPDGRPLHTVPGRELRPPVPRDEGRFGSRRPRRFDEDRE
ncbi:hypothetical protein H696_01750 [Fonticula alba]|uniref:CSD domain-containing protein n=1 Tax=Fonticula alba TaxID=691883 RepID=A0A058ZFV8_FONAL|nr:hypothetical protein H696_01750 [Fonticula alba]KCV72357.1 hypothetical protein H696_01750 [Fonticula alba]|eukprot:XP_009493935.1 hypothetical protein H696_01750 [Fonticula alba]